MITGETGDGSLSPDSGTLLRSFFPAAVAPLDVPRVE